MISMTGWTRPKASGGDRQKSARSDHLKASTESETIQNYYLHARSMGMQSVGKEIQQVADGR
jgi:hypothetical protein